MHSTPASLLERLRKPSEAAAWNYFVELYSPLLFRWAKRAGLQDSDAGDLVQDVFVILWKKLPTFRYDRSQSFHAWLKTVFLNEHRQRLRSPRPAALGSSFETPGDSSEQLDDPEHRAYLIRRAFALIEREFAPLQTRAFREYVLRERSVDDVARELGLSVGTIYAIKSKVLSKLRHDLRDLLD
jgi:RNA polymerase sigma-70 factor (ECF subfamily)